MALDRLTKITGPGIATDTNWVGNNANYTGIVTATKFVGPIEGTITSADASFTGNVSIGGTLTYEDVTNIDSVGIITAAKDIHVGAGVSAVGVITGRYLNPSSVSTQNLIIGWESSARNVTGSWNVLLGRRAGEGLTSGGSAVCIGANAGQLLGSASGIFIGGQAGSKVTGSGNVFIGQNAGQQTTSAGACTIIGTYAGIDNQGSNNTLVGNYAGRGNSGVTDGAQNTFLGTASGFKIRGGDDNTGVGYYSLVELLGGNKNVAIGRNAGDALVSGNNNIIIGYNADASTSSISNEITLGDANINHLRIPGIGVSFNNTGGTQLGIITATELDISGDIDVAGVSTFSDKVIIGGGTSRSLGWEHLLQVEHTNSTPHGISLVGNRPNQYGPNLTFAKTRSASLGGNTIVQDNDTLAQLVFRGADGVDLANISAMVGVVVDGTPAENNVPGAFEIYTGGLNKKLTIDASGNVLVGTTDNAAYNNTSEEGIVLRGGDCIDIARNGDGQLYLNRLGSDGAHVYFYRDGTQKTSISTRNNSFCIDINNSEKLRVDTSGDVLIGTTDDTVYNNSSGEGVVIRGGDCIDIARNNDNQLFLNRQGGDGYHIAFLRDGSYKSFISTRSNAFCIDVNGSERYRITSDGKFSLGNINSSPAAAVHIDYDTNNMLMLDNSTASTQKIFFAQDAATHAQIYATSTQGSLIFESDPSNNHNDSVINFTIDGTSRFRINNSGISTFSGDVAVYGSKFKLPIGTSNPSSPLAGDSYFNTSAKTFKIYDGSGWGSVLFAASGSQQNPATSASNLGATGSIATYYFSPDGGTAFQHQAAGGVANFGTIPSGGPSWVGSHNSCILIEKSQVGATTQYKLSQANFLKFIAESITRTGNTPYIYWAVFDTGTLWGIWRIRWTGATYSSWVSGHDYNGTNTPPSGTPSSDVWKTGSGSTGNTLATGSYTVSNESNLVRAVLPGAAYSGGGSYGIHYKRYDDGEHYPWRNSAGNCTSNGYFRPSGTYGMGTDTRYVHYIYLSDS